MRQRVIVCGDRNWRDKKAIERRLAGLKVDTLIIQGGNGYLEDGTPCRTREELLQAVRGADALAFQVAHELGLQTATLFAEWEVFGRGAGPRRNQLMLQLHPDLVIAFHPDLSRSRGTKDMVTRAERAGVEVVHVKR